MTGLLLAMLLSCTRDTGTDTGPTLDTGWFVDTGDHSADTCPNRFLQSVPEEGETDWYWRTWPRLWTSTDVTAAYGAQLADGYGRVVPTEPRWDESGLVLDLAFEGGLQPSTDFRLELHDCRGPHEIPFTTSALGTPLVGGADSLVGKTWVIDLSDADWIQPEGFGAVLSLYFTTPILIGVEWADDHLIDLMGAMGNVTELGDVVQITSEPSWDFPMADFTDQPLLAAVAPQVDVEFQEVLVSIYEFSLEGTFAADGSQLGGGVVRGTGDTRNMGVFLGNDDPSALCDLAEGMGSECIACPDGYRYCLEMEAHSVDGSLVPGLTLVKK